MREMDGHMGQYRKKPVVVHAIQWTGTNKDAVLEFASAVAMHFSGVAFEREDSISPVGVMGTPGQLRFTDRGLEVSTLEGRMSASIGDFIICGVSGELYPCKPDIFEKTYEEER